MKKILIDARQFAEGVTGVDRYARSVISRNNKFKNITKVVVTKNNRQLGTVIADNRFCRTAQLSLLSLGSSVFFHFTIYMCHVAF